MDVATSASEVFETFVDNARAALESESRLVDVQDTGEPRFELFHAANSICSQKVRVVFAHHQMPYRVNELNMLTGETYLPDYVRLRMIGCDALGGHLAALHSGSTSATDHGCDGVVVPTLIDHKAGTVVVDSKRICLWLDEQMKMADRLRPDYLAGVIEAELAIVDVLPNYQMLVACLAANGVSAETLAERASALPSKKVGWCDSYLAEYADDDALARAYRAKRSKELSARETLFSPKALEHANLIARRALEDLENRLQLRNTHWLLSDQVTMADLFWGLELLRIENIGAAYFWENGRLPLVADYIESCRELPEIEEALLKWPGAIY